MRGRFVIQEHHSKRLHFDLRLEINGIAKSWAVPKGPSMNPKDRRLALAVPDHSLKSMSFEGTRRAGLYGAGEVATWDRGEYETALDPQRSLDKGWLVFTLNGRKLKGQFMLERWTTNYFNWSLYKLTDEFADPNFKLKKVLKPRAFPGFAPLFEGLATETRQSVR
jgi:bifunctional non-homologous end joining protein LigD